MNSKKILNLVYSAIFASIILIATAYLPKITFPGGYVHIGDAFIYLAACVLPAGYAMAAGALGGALADLIFTPIWAPYTFIIKAIIALLFSSKGKRIATKRNIIMTIPAAIITVAGYYIAEAVMYKSFVVPLTSIGYNAIQGVGSAVLFVIIGYAFDKFSFKKLFSR